MNNISIMARQLQNSRAIKYLGRIRMAFMKFKKISREGSRVLGAIKYRQMKEELKEYPAYSTDAAGYHEGKQT